jgi:hypothetical protein
MGLSGSTKLKKNSNSKIKSLTVENKFISHNKTYLSSPTDLELLLAQLKCNRCNENE